MAEFKIPDGEHEFEKTILRLEEQVHADVRAFMRSECRFVGVGEEVKGHTISPGAALGVWIIVLRESETEESIVAHELAHAWLGHHYNSPEIEAEARAQAIAWGFSGPAADR